MSEVVLRNEDPDVLPVIAEVRPDGSVVPNLSDSGWSIDTDTDPAAARAEITRRTLEAETKTANDRPAPHFASVAVPEGDPVDLAQAQPAPTPEQVDTTSEQGSASLDLTKE